MWVWTYSPTHPPTHPPHPLAYSSAFEPPALPLPSQHIEKEKRVTQPPTHPPTYLQSFPALGAVSHRVVSRIKDKLALEDRIEEGVPQVWWVGGWVGG